MASRHEGESQFDVHGVFRIHGADHELTLHPKVDKNVKWTYGL